MKLRLILLTSLIICLLYTSQSQTLVKENNSWSNLIEVSPNSFTNHYQKIQGDTTIDNKVYKKLLGTTYSQLINWKYEGALRETEPGKVYFKKAGVTAEHLLYDFTLNVNDIFTGYYNECEFMLKLNSIEEIMLMNGENRKQFHFTGIAGYFYSENWIAEIGSDNGLTYAGVFGCTPVTSDTTPTLNCFTENGTVKVYNNADFPCYSLVGLTENPHQVASQIIPNPVTDVATLDMPGVNIKDLSLAILDSLGKEVLRINSVKGNKIIFNREGLPGGIYLYSVYSGSTQIAKGKFIIR